LRIVFPTAEVRWFFRGPIPPYVEAWFRWGQGRVEQEPGREDRYLQLADIDSLGIKLREDRIEIKQRVGQQSLVRFHERVAGIVEHWRKWSFELAESGSALSSAAVPAASWIPVRKERRLRRYRVADDGDAVALSSSAPPDRGCELELTSVDVAGGPGGRWPSKPLESHPPFERISWRSSGTSSPAMNPLLCPPKTPAATQRG
jgi:hypothetical protein